MFKYQQEKLVGVLARLRRWKLETLADGRRQGEEALTDGTSFEELVQVKDKAQEANFGFTARGGVFVGVDRVRVPCTLITQEGNVRRP